MREGYRVDPIAMALERLLEGAGARVPDLDGPVV
jgi:hypothetical protein